MCAGRDDTAVKVTAGNFHKRDDLHVRKLDVIIDFYYYWKLHYDGLAKLVVINNYYTNNY